MFLSSEGSMGQPQLIELWLEVWYQVSHGVVMFPGSTLGEWCYYSGRFESLLLLGQAFSPKQYHC
jgi:hypothetical protein